VSRESPASEREVRKAAVLWGVVAALAFLVLVQAYRLLRLGRLPFGVVAVAGVVVFVVATLVTYRVGP
jgi:archaellum biogenesis protein FlaJ (TadC family)